MDATDDSIVASEDLIAREQDHIVLTLDARPDPERSQNEELWEAINGGAMAKLINEFVSLVEAKEDPLQGLFIEREASGIRSAAQRRDGGYTAEISLPNAVLDERRGERWDALRLNLTLNDFDEGEDGHRAVAWRPSRFGTSAVEGAGTFARSGD